MTLAPRWLARSSIEQATTADGEGGVQAIDRFGYLSNDEFALHGDADVRLRVLTTGRLLPRRRDRTASRHVRGFLPSSRSRSAWRHDHAEQGSVPTTRLLGDLAILGLSDLRRAENHKDGIQYDDCHAGHDNYIDIILIGDDAAARNITAGEIPSLHGGYRAFSQPRWSPPPRRAV